MEDEIQGDNSVTIPLLHSNGDVILGSKDDQIINIANASFISTCFNCLNALSGVGIVSIPYAMASGGWLSLILLLAIASLTFYTGLLIQRCMDTDPTITSYPDIGSRAFGSIGKTIVSITMDMEVYLVATGFLILEGDNLSNLFPDMDFYVYGFHVDAKSGFIVLVSFIILPTCWLHNMNILSYVSASGVLASMIILGSVLWVGVFDGVGFHEKGKIVTWKGMPSAVSLYAFCYCAHTVFPTLYTSMRNKRQYSKVLLICFTLCTITYGLMGVLGYLMFGSKVESQITLNLPTDNISSRVAIYTILVTPLAKYALQMTPIFNAIESRFLSSNNQKMYSFFIRTTLMISTVIIAVSLPLFGYLMALVGALLSATTSVTIPCLCYLKISGIYKRIGVEVVIIGFVLLCGLIVAVVGTYVSMVDIVTHL